MLDLTVEEEPSTVDEANAVLGRIRKAKGFISDETRAAISNMSATSRADVLSWRTGAQKMEAAYTKRYALT